MKFTLYPIGRIQKTRTKTRIVIYKKYQPGLMDVEKLSEIWVIWWFNRNDNPPPAFIEVADLTKRFGEVNAANRVSFDVRKGELFGCLGPQRRRQDHYDKYADSPRQARYGHDQDRWPGMYAQS
jgi:hypothetical protein